MKKFYSLFSVILLWLFFAPELSAAQYYLAGDFTSWARGKVELKQEGTSNLYKATADVKANQSFKMICVNNGKTYWWGRGKSDKEFTLKEGEPLQVWAPENGSSGGNIKIGVTGKYVFTFNTSNNNISIAKAGVDPQPEPEPTPAVEMPAALYVVGNIEGANWDVTEGKAVSMTKGETSFTVANVTLKNGAAADVYFSFITKVAPVATADKDKWDVVNSSDRFGSETANATLVDGSAKVVKYAVNVNASSATSWKVPAGVYTLTVDFKTMTLTAEKTGEITPEPAPAPPAEDGPKLHFKNTWTTTGKLFVYAYNTAAVAKAAPGVLTASGATEHTGPWPGKEMTEGENGWFSAVLPATVDADTKVIFNDGDKNQLPASSEAGISLGTIGAESWYDPATGGWAETNPDEGPSAINNAQADSNNANRVVMNLQGVKVSGKASGWVIIVDGNETTKAYIK